MISINVRSLCRLVEYENGLVKYETCSSRNDIDIQIRKKDQTDFVFHKTIHNEIGNIMILEIDVDLGRKLNENVQLTLSGVDYNRFVFGVIDCVNYVNVSYFIENENMVRNRLCCANYYDLSQLVQISKLLLGAYLNQRKILLDKKKKKIRRNRT